MREIIGSIDIGTDSIKLVVGEFFNNEFNILCALSEPTKGYFNYEITNEALLIKSIKKLIEKSTEKLGFKIKKVIANIPTTNNHFVISEAVNTITNEEKIVTSNDILRVMQSTAYNRVSINEELLSAIPIMFSVGEEETDDPFNKKGKTIAAKTVLVTCAKKEVYDIVGILEKSGLEVIDISTSGLASYYNFKNNYLDTKTGVIVNIGESSTILSIFSKGIYINNEVIPVGGGTIDKAICYSYKLRRRDAKVLKENLALASIRRASPKENIKITNKELNEIVINQYELTEIVENELVEILKSIKNSINHLTKKEISYIIITGGLTELNDFNITLTSLFGETAKIGDINNLGARKNKYNVAIGMIKQFKEKLKLRHREYSMVSESDIESMCIGDSKTLIASDSILGKVFGYFFDN